MYPGYSNTICAFKNGLGIKFEFSGSVAEGIGERLWDFELCVERVG